MSDRFIRIRNLVLGLFGGILYCIAIFLIVAEIQEVVSFTYVFLLPLVAGAIPVFFTSKEQIQVFWKVLVWPWFVIAGFLYSMVAFDMEGLICVLIILGPFLMLGALGAFLVRTIRLYHSGKQTPLYPLLLLPLFCVGVEHQLNDVDYVGHVESSVVVEADRAEVWEQLTHIGQVKVEELDSRLIHWVGVPMPESSSFDRREVGGKRHIVCQKRVQFIEEITDWKEEESFSFDVDVNPYSIPPYTLDEHVMIGGRYFDVLSGGYRLEEAGEGEVRLVLEIDYRVSTNLNFYAKWWAELFVGQLNETVLGLIKRRSEAELR